MEMLCDTVCVWALYFRDSIYRKHILKLRSKHRLLIPDICLIEASYPIYKAKGLKEIEKYSKFVEMIPLSQNIEIIKIEIEDIARALKIAYNNPQTFIDREGNLCLFDAIITSIWYKKNIPLITTDKKLIKLAEKENLTIIKLKQEKHRNHH